MQSSRGAGGKEDEEVEVYIQETSEVFLTNERPQQEFTGRFECSVSSLRWVCKEKVSLQYQFCSWEEHRHRPSCKDYIPAGPLMDITVTAGKLEEVQLPHWIDHNPKMPHSFAVLHVKSCGDSVERVSEVTSSHVKLLQPTFSPIGVMIQQFFGFPVNVFYDVLMYKKIQTALKLHVYLVPPDPALQKAVEKEQNSVGSIKLLKPGPDKSMVLGDNLSLKTDKAGAHIQPRTRELRYDSRNLFEVFLRNADGDFTLKLKSEQNTIWSCSIFKEDYQTQSTGHKQGQHFVAQHRRALINRVSVTAPILDELVERELISKETYNDVKALATTQDQMRKILAVLNTAIAKDGLYKILKGMTGTEHLISELEASG
ncbi:NACHT, LRR and PYD domains-containing protein 1b allele 2-like [Centropristis striata]|uniref:NACHT, LRR and PYD domains-containing protein 1b allele 2-like n=1 Tax=Centropristis striata TaxID=184440 RepID=UPI0027E1DC16|nr:NACHT, LRR and PYD domains-containing protein 1b allele 2-like [Centropristis striata]